MSANQTYPSPDDVFSAAQQAMSKGDWDTFFRCVDATDLPTLASNSLKGLALLPAAREGLETLCAEQSFPLSDLRGELSRFAASAARVMQAAPGAQRQESLRHRDVVHGLEHFIRDAVKAVKDPPGFTAALERLMRAHRGGGSVSSSWFQGERLEQVQVKGARASGVRRMASGAELPLVFKKTKQGWRVKLLGRVRL